MRFKTLTILFFIFLGFSNFQSKNFAIGGQRTFFVSPHGDDSNPGSKNRPWKSLAKAAETLKSGDLALFEDGVYFEDRIVNFSYDGERDRKIVLKSRNKHKAKIVFSRKLKNTAKIRFIGRRFIELLDFDITQLERSLKNDNKRTSDMMIVCSNGSEEITIAGNRIHYCFEEGIKIAGSKDISIKNNLIFNTEHEGIDAVNVANVILEGNVIAEAGRVGILVKGRSKDVKIFNNIVKNQSKEMKGHGIAIGGETKLNVPVYSSKPYEAYNIYAWNNVVIAKDNGKIKWGISFIGSKDSYAFNNVVIGTEYAIAFYSPNGMKNGWGWNPIVTNAFVKNNIMYNIQKDVFFRNHKPIGIDSDFNMFYKVGGLFPLDEKNSLRTNPLFIDPNSNWELSEKSPAIGTAFILPDELISLINLKFTPYVETRESPKRNMGLIENISINDK